jgi:hypothetical protein
VINEARRNDKWEEKGMDGKKKGMVILDKNASGGISYMDGEQTQQTNAFEYAKHAKQGVGLLWVKKRGSYMGRLRGIGGYDIFMRWSLCV